MTGDINWLLTALFNPVFLFLLVVLFFMGRLVGWMTRSINIWKSLALAYFGVFLFQPLREAGLVIGGVFILGVASMYTDLFREIFRWSGSLGDVFSAFRYRSAYDDIRRMEQEIEELKAQLRRQQAANAGDGGGSTQQQNWRAQSRARKAARDNDGKSNAQSATGGQGGSNQQSSGSTFSGYSDGIGQNGRAKPSGQGRSGKRSTSGTSGSKSRSSSSNRQSSANSQRQNNRQSGSSRAQSGAQSGSNQGQGTNNTGSAGSSGGMSSALRDKYLQTLELTPGKTYTPAEIKAAWRKMAFKTHPDKGGSAAAFAAVRAAYKALS